MKASVVFSVAVLAASAGVASAQYPDPVNDTFLGNSAPWMDLAGVSVSDNGTDLFITIQASGPYNNNDGSQNWAKYLVWFDLDGAASGNEGNGWGRNVDTNRASDYYVGTWVDGSGGGEIYRATGSNNGDWSRTDATWEGSTRIALDNSQAALGITVIRVNLAAIGATEPNTKIFFDVATTGGGGGDPGVDHLSRADFATTAWDVQSVSGEFLSYRTVPAPGALALVGMGVMVAGRRRR